MDKSQLAQSIFRKALPQDIEAAWQILEQGKAQMLREGKRQWSATLPNRAGVERDVARGTGHVLEFEGEVIAYGSVAINGEPEYERLSGTWITEGDYVVVHRFAVADSCKRCGVARHFMQCVEKQALEAGVKSSKIDTNYDNFYMHRLLRGMGYRYCGTVVYPQGSRMCYEHVLEPENAPADAQLLATEFYHIGNSFMQIGESRQAVANYYRAIELDPESPAAEAIEHYKAIMDFYNKDLYNP